ncbi:hypothetical protein THASP1DRAFT_32640 [Thamnocephalis sphaerospora]|uniref:magnesium chelatase n=1 Tax=Thamnocephalis sphaerospora TaxID=78915 RepID=A0A4P9XIJ3_9FUNG|nr:hypothetical protein THASP1DRAFT_32640 [Thamnocephalis sphaerospora]|eukprot:RKP05522.1 hypothetical protein THASP1DRAFT_32640 [Thamnocephalis sphaerospora]
MDRDLSQSTQIPLNPLKVKRNWLQQRLRSLRRTCPFQFSDDVFITLLLCLVAGRRCTLLCSRETAGTVELRKQVEMICSGIFGMSVHAVRRERLLNAVDPATAFFQRPETPGSSLRVRITPGPAEVLQAHDPFANAFAQVPSPSSPPPNGGRLSPTLVSPTPVRFHHSAPYRRRTHKQKHPSILSATSKNNGTLLPSMDSTWTGTTQPLVAEPDAIDDLPRTSNTTEPSHAYSPSVASTKRQPGVPSTATQSGTYPRLLQPQRHAATMDVPGNRHNARRVSQQRSMRESFMLSDRTGEDRQLAQVLIVENVEDMDESVIGVLMELVVHGRIRDRYGVHNVPAPFMLVCVSSRPSLAEHPLPPFLLDRFLLGYTYSLPMEVESTTDLSFARHSSSASLLSAKQVLLPYAEIHSMGERCNAMTISMPIGRYLRDIVTAARMHPAVQAGVSARTILDMETVVCALATLYGRNFVTPELVMIATEKVLAHRLRIRPGFRYEAPEEIIADILRAIHPPV